MGGGAQHEIQNHGFDAGALSRALDIDPHAVRSGVARTQTHQTPQRVIHKRDGSWSTACCELVVHSSRSFCPIRQGEIRNKHAEFTKATVGLIAV